MAGLCIRLISYPGHVAVGQTSSVTHGPPLERKETSRHTLNILYVSIPKLFITRRTRNDFLKLSCRRNHMWKLTDLINIVIKTKDTS